MDIVDHEKDKEETDAKGIRGDNGKDCVFTIDENKIHNVSDEEFMFDPGLTNHNDYAFCMASMRCGCKTGALPKGFQFQVFLDCK